MAAAHCGRHRGPAGGHVQERASPVELELTSPLAVAAPTTAAAAQTATCTAPARYASCTVALYQVCS